ncbi:MAG TPA: hypothetical protein VFS43_32895 [Polyangiaceae bacterium]|nr:hypothetical protein [Polyangiaceae bacterium]
MRARGLAAWALGAALLGAAAPGRAAPIGPGVETAAVLGLEADLSNDLAAKTLTNALRQQVLDSAEYTLSGESPPLAVKAGEAKCSLKGLRRPLTEASDLSFDAACLGRLGALLGVKRYFWGHFYSEGSRPFVRLHFWREGESDRAVTLPYDEAERERLAERLYRKLAIPEKVGDVALTSAGPLEGELYVDGKPRGALRPRVELTLLGGEHSFELRRDGKAVAQAKAQVVAGGWVDVRLEPLPLPLPDLAPQIRVGDIPPVTRRRESSALPWVFGGVGAAALIGAGTFFALYRGAQSDLDDACAPDKSCRGQQATIDRSRLYSALSLASFGVVAGAGAGLYLSLRSRGPEEAVVSRGRPGPGLWGGVAPLAGGGAAALAGGRF